MPYRDPAPKPEMSAEELWARMWCGQRHPDDLKALVRPVEEWEALGFGRLFRMNPTTRAHIPGAARDELERREKGESFQDMIERLQR